jgi:predicted nucleic acid-binding protein
MRVLVDTPIWSFAFRRKHPGGGSAEATALGEWTRLVAERRAVLCGPVRMEVLSGLADEAWFSRVRDRLRWFPDEALLTEDYEEAARCWNSCRSVGIATTQPDMILCAVAVRSSMPIFTTDRDFARYARVLPIRLHAPR